jgi:pyrroloquinoline-quinone synthase
VRFWDRLEQLRERGDVLRHPFYQRWSAGELSSNELALYAGQYRHAVVALADASVAAARTAEPELADELAQHAREESEHIALWDAFAAAVGADPDAEPLPQTAACAAAWAGEGRPLSETLTALYVIEAAQPAISEAKRLGLREHYGITDPAATAYFDVHVERDVQHAASGRALLEERLGTSDQEAMLAAAETVLAGNWSLLDGVQQR